MADHLRIDAVDLQILDILRTDCRTSLDRIGDAVGLTKTPVAARIKRMERTGVIKAYSAQIQLDLLAPPTICILLDIKLSSPNRDKSRDAFTSAVQEMSEVTECLSVSGEVDFALKVHVSSIPDYERLVLNRFAQIPGVERITSHFVLSTLKEDSGPTTLVQRHAQTVEAGDASTDEQQPSRQDREAALLVLRATRLPIRAR